MITDPQVRQVAGGQELVTSQVLPDGTYTWVIEATDDGGRTPKAAGPDHAQGRRYPLPDLLNFTVTPKEFTPNQDGIDDRVSIAYTLAKKAEHIQVFLEQPGRDPSQAGLRYPIAEDPTATASEPGDAGYHGYSYDGGVDLNAEPPPDGDYVIKAEAEDRVGNHVVVSSTLTIKEGGKPRADVAGGQINWQGEQSRAGGGSAGPDPLFYRDGHQYRSGADPHGRPLARPALQVQREQQYAGAEATTSRPGTSSTAAGASAINFDTTGGGLSFPLGHRPANRTWKRRVIDGQTQYYLLPGHRGQVSGCILFDKVPPGWHAVLVGRLAPRGRRGR